MAKKSLEERVSKIEGTLTQMDRRLNHLETELMEFRKEVRQELRTKVDKWEVRIWFAILIFLTTILSLLT